MIDEDFSSKKHRVARSINNENKIQPITAKLNKFFGVFINISKLIPTEYSILPQVLTNLQYVLEFCSIRTEGSYVRISDLK